jgi:hypothetical protein
LARCIDRGLTLVESDQETIRAQVEEIKEVSATLDPATGDCEHRRQEFEKLAHRFKKGRNPHHAHMARLMIAFSAGLFAGGDDVAEIQDNLDLERFFRLPKSHERRIHGHRHAGVRIVQEGPTLVLVLDAHQAHPERFNADDLMPYRKAREPDCQRQAMQRRKIMRKARSKKKRGELLADLERRYLAAF